VLAWKFVVGYLGSSLRVETVWVVLVFHVNSGCWRDMIGEVLGCEVLVLVSAGRKCDDEVCVIRGGGDGRSEQQAERSGCRVSGLCIIQQVH